MFINALSSRGSIHVLLPRYNFMRSSLNIAVSKLGLVFDTEMSEPKNVDYCVCAAADQRAFAAEPQTLHNVQRFVEKTSYLYLTDANWEAGIKLQKKSYDFTAVRVNLWLCHLKQRKERALPLRHNTHRSDRSLSFSLTLTEKALPCFKGHCLCIHTSDLMCSYVESVFLMASFMFSANAPLPVQGPSPWSMSGMHALWLSGQRTSYG